MKAHVHPRGPGISQLQLDPTTAVLFATVVAFGTWTGRALSLRGAIAAAAVGSVVLMGGGWPGGAALAAFFLTSVAPSYAFPKAAVGLQLDRGPRTARQVAANGGAALIGGLIGMVHADLGLWVIVAALAGATADTWSSEAGKALGGQPADILTRLPVERGASGGVTWAGTIAGAIGASVIGTTGALVAGSVPLGIAGASTGFAAMLADSVIGSRWQARFACGSCGESSESRAPDCSCGQTSVLSSGVAWIDNNTVNALATSAAGLAGGLCWWWCSAL